MGVLRVQWIHLSIEGETCQRCASTGGEIERAIQILRQVLSPLGIEVEVEEVILPPEEFSRDPLRSNEIWLNGRLLED